MEDEKNPEDRLSNRKRGHMGNRMRVRARARARIHTPERLRELINKTYKPKPVVF